MSDQLFQRLPFKKCTDRIKWITQKCINKKVLDIGCLDETAFMVKKEGNHWLHGELAAKSKGIIGIDSSPLLDQLKQSYPEKLNTIFAGTLNDAKAIIDRENFRPDVIVCGELIEHLERPSDLFAALAPIVIKHNAELILTTPNPFAYQALLMIMLRFESQHIDHQCLLSPKILMRLGKKYGLETTEIRTAFTSYDEFMAQPGMLKYILKIMNAVIFKPAQMLFPGIGGGLLIAFKPAREETSLK